MIPVGLVFKEAQECGMPICGEAEESAASIIRVNSTLL
jgi:hypothetical protein